MSLVGRRGICSFLAFDSSLIGCSERCGFWDGPPLSTVENMSMWRGGGGGGGGERETERQRQRERDRDRERERERERETEREIT